MRTRFSPCGHVWTYLRSCYSTKFRVYIGGVETHVPVRWYFCPPDAPFFPFPHGAESHVWLKTHEQNEEWGEYHRWKTRDWGENPGYVAGCFAGDPQWFLDGHLPADILDGPIPAFSRCCFMAGITLYHVNPGEGDPAAFEIDAAAGVRFDGASGLALVDDEDSTGTILLMPASPVHSGGVTTGAQSWAGVKMLVNPSTPGDASTMTLSSGGLSLAGCQSAPFFPNLLMLSLAVAGGPAAWGNVDGESLTDESDYYGGGPVSLDDDCVQLFGEGLAEGSSAGIVIRMSAGAGGSGQASYLDFVSYQGFQPAIRIIDAFERTIYTGQTGRLAGGGRVTGGIITLLPSDGLTGTFP